MKKPANKLGLHREIVKQLSTAALRDAAGGVRNTGTCQPASQTCFSYCAQNTCYCP